MGMLLARYLGNLWHLASPNLLKYTLNLSHVSLGVYLILMNQLHSKQICRLTVNKDLCGRAFDFFC